MKVRDIVILLVEDEPGDVELTRLGLARGKLRHTLHVARDGVECMAFLRREGEFADAPRPELILLDLNMPRMNGREVLAAIKADEDLRLIPVVVLTSSDAEADIAKSYALHANCFIRKPVTLERFAAVVRSIEGFWFSVVRLPIPKA
jgi:two-component system, chemotaxis family, response regulator Rcp1